MPRFMSYSMKYFSCNLLFFEIFNTSLEDVLLQQKQIATNFEIRFGVDLSYTFGSAFNNVINIRLQLSGQETLDIGRIKQ